MKNIIILSVILGTISSATGLTLTGAYNASLNYETKIKSLDYKEKVKEIEIDMAESQLYPHVDASLNYQRRRYEYRGINSDQNYHSYSISLNQVVYHPEIISQIESKELTHDLSSLDLTRQKQILAYNITDSYMQVLLKQNSIKVAQAYLDAANIHFQQIEKKFQLRLANKMDYLESKVAYKQANIMLEQEKSAWTVAKMKLKSLTGIEIPALPDIDFESIDISKLSLDKEVSLNQSLELERAQKSFEISKKEIDISEFGHYPKVDLRGSFSNLSSKEIINEYKDDRRITLTLSIPIYKGGYVSYNIQRNRLLMNSAVEQIEDIKREESVKYDEFKVEYQIAKENIRLYKDTKESAKAYLDSVAFGYKKGLKNIYELEDAKKKFTETKYKLINSIYKLIRAYTSILNLSGKMDSKHIAQLDNLLGF